MTDEQFESCMLRMANGDRQALREIYDAYLNLIFAVIYNTIRQREEAEDLTSEFFIKLYGLAASYRSGNGHRKWLTVIARNMTIDRIRRLDREIVADELPEPGGDGEDFSERVADRETLKSMINELTPAEKEVLDMKCGGELTFKEISEILEKPMGTVSWLYNSAIKKLRKKYKKGGMTDEDI